MLRLLKRCIHGPHCLWLCLLLASTANSFGDAAKSWFRALEGAYPMDRPELTGVAQVMVLSNQWLVIVVDPFEDFVRAMDGLTEGDYSKAIAGVKNAMARKHQTDAWVYRAALEKMRWTHAVDARRAGPELKMKQVGFYEIESVGDAHYAQGRHPTRVTTALISIDHGVEPGYDSVRYGVYAYLEMPEPMIDGQHYQIRLEDGKSVHFLFDTNATIARTIKVNQIGYQPGKATNYAYVGGYLQEFGAMPLGQLSRFEIVDVHTGDVIEAGSLEDGKIQLRDDASRMDPKDTKDQSERPYITGERLYELDLSQIDQPGTYFIRVPGVGRSWPFRVNNDVYGAAFYVAMRGLYHQRASFALEAPYTAWARPRYHTGPIYESEMLPYWADSTKVTDLRMHREVVWPRFDIVGATTNLSLSTHEVEGGWYDAADYDRNLYHYNVVFDLLKLYEFYPEKFTDGQLNLPESGNGIPDILDEAEYGLRIWKHSQKANGGVSGMVETWSHPSIDDDRYEWSFARRTRWSSLIYAAAAAELSRHLKAFDPSAAEDYATSAIVAYQFATGPEHSMDGAEINAAEKRGTGAGYSLRFSESSDYNHKFFIMAGVQLYLLTGDAGYLRGMEALYSQAPAPYVWPFSERDFSPWLYFDLAYDPNVRAQVEFVSQTIQSKVASSLIEPARNFAQLNVSMPYRQSWPRRQDYWMSWGATDMTNRAKVQLIAHQLNPDPALLTAAQFNLTYMFGANPMGMSWTTGIGFTYPVAIQHESSMNDGILDPYPGMTLYGNTAWHVFNDLRNRVWRYPETIDLTGKPTFNSQDPNDFATFYSLPEHYPVFRRWAAHPTLNVEQNEFTIHETNSSTIFVLGMLMDAGWMPSEALKQRGPRDPEDLFGYWYLP